jgi:hypothetical protein
MSVGEGEQEQLEIQKTKEGVHGGHWYMDEKLDSFRFDVTGNFNLE